jgi:hypothetical protein
MGVQNQRLIVVSVLSAGFQDNIFVHIFQEMFFYFQSDFIVNRFSWP